MIPIVLVCATLLMSDGDSGRCVTEDGVRHRVRLAGIDAGEVAPFTRCRQRPGIWACSPEARASSLRATVRARELAADGAMCAEVDIDRYGRSVVMCYVQEGDLGGLLVSEGLAISDPAYEPPYTEEQDRAKRERRGIWQ
jgi:endonuclease YncB( thermonuclease family)